MFNEIYWATRLCEIHEIFYIILIIFTVIESILLVVILVLAMDDDFTKEDLAFLNKFVTISLMIFTFLLLVFCLCPSERDMALILGWEAMTCESAQEVYKKVIEHLVK